MQRFMLRSKIPRAPITGLELNYEGSITIDKRLMEEADILTYERVEVLNINNGARFSTYAIVYAVRVDAQANPTGATSR